MVRVRRLWGCLPEAREVQVHAGRHRCGTQTWLADGTSDAGWHQPCAGACWAGVMKRHDYIRDELCHALGHIPGVRAKREPKVDNPRAGGDHRG